MKLVWSYPTCGQEIPDAYIGYVVVLLILVLVIMAILDFLQRILTRSKEEKARKPTWNWTCHICGEERPNNNISVLIKPYDLDHKFVAQQHIRYCNDRPECIKGAQTFSFLKEEAENDG